MENKDNSRGYKFYANRDAAVPCFLDRNGKPMVRSALSAGIEPMPVWKSTDAVIPKIVDGVEYAQDHFWVICEEDAGILNEYLEAGANASSIVNWRFTELFTVLRWTPDTRDEGEHQALSRSPNSVDADTKFRQLQYGEAGDLIVGYYSKTMLIEAILRDLTTKSPGAMYVYAITPLSKVTNHRDIAAAA